MKSDKLGRQWVSKLEVVMADSLLTRLFGATMAPEPDLPKPPPLLVFKPPVPRKLTEKEKAERAELGRWFVRRLDELRRKGCGPIIMPFVKRERLGQ